VTKERTAKDNRAYQRNWYERNSHYDGILYLIINTVTQDTYLGMTVRPLNKRLWQYKAAAKAGSKSPLCENIREHGPDVFKIEEIYRGTAETPAWEKYAEYKKLYEPTLNAR